MIFPNGVVFWLAVAGGCVVILGTRRAGIALASPAFVRFVLWPNFAPALDQVPVTPLLLVSSHLGVSYETMATEDRTFKPHGIR
jgi:hypothetical protein